MPINKDQHILIMQTDLKINMDSFQVCDMDILWSLGGYIFRLSCFTLTSWSRNPSIEITLHSGQELNYTAYVMYVVVNRNMYSRNKSGVNLKLSFMELTLVWVYCFILYIYMYMYVCMYANRPESVKCSSIMRLL